MSFYDLVKQKNAFSAPLILLIILDNTFIIARLLFVLKPN